MCISKHFYQWTYLILSYGEVNFEPSDISETRTQSRSVKVDLFENSTDHKCLLTSWKFHFPRQIKYTQY